MEGPPSAGPGRGPVYIYNGVADLRELREVSLNGANLFFNGSFCIEDLRNVNFNGAKVFWNGQLQSTTKMGPSSDATTAATPSILQNSSSRARATVRKSSQALGTGGSESSIELADKVDSPTQVDHQGHQNAGFYPFARKEPEPDRNVITSRQILPRNPNRIPLGPNRKVEALSCGENARTSEMTNDRCQQPVRLGGCEAPAVLGSRIQGRPLENTEFTNPRLEREESLPGTIPKVASSGSPINSRWTPYVPLGLTAQKRPSVAEISNHLDSESKKQRLESHDDFDLTKQTEMLVQEKIERGKRARRLSDRSNGQGATAEYERIRKLSHQRNEIRSQLLGQTQRRPATQIMSFGSSRNRLSGAGSQEMPCLPHDSPLNNVINSATLQEQIVQAKIEYNLAEKQLIAEKARQGFASRAILARVKVLNETLAALHKKRGEIRSDADRLEAFRRCDLRGYGREDGDCKWTTPKSPPLSPTDSEWKNRLTLCYEALERTEPCNEAVKNMKRESPTLSAEDEAMIKQETTDPERLLRIGGAGALDIPQPRQVRFALTGVETYL